MIDWKLIIGILSSSVLAALLTKLLDLYSISINYKRDFYKKIIEKRIDSHERALNFAIKYLGYRDFRNPYSDAFIDFSTFENFKTDVADLGPFRVWYSHAVNDNLRKVIKVAMDSHDFITESHKEKLFSVHELHKLGRDTYNELSTLLQELHRLLSQEILIMDDVKSFINTKRS